MQNFGMNMVQSFGLNQQQNWIFILTSGLTYRNV
jgi:hypothetical protein